MTNISFFSRDSQNHVSITSYLYEGDVSPPTTAPSPPHVYRCGNMGTCIRKRKSNVHFFLFLGFKLLQNPCFFFFFLFFALHLFPLLQQTKTNKTPFFFKPSTSSMANSSKKKTLPSTAKLTQLLTIDGKEYVSEPPFAEEKAKIWRSQVLISFYLSNKPLAFLGRLPENRQPEITQKISFFPTSHLSESLVSSQKSFSLHYVEMNFRTAPLKNCPKFCAWMDRLEAEKIDHWK